jgi:NDP-sugar pyrophosphorylase family protein
MAAGMGARYGGLKQVERVGPGGEMIVDYSIFDAIRAGFERAVFIIRRDIEEEFKRAVGDRFEGRIAVDYVFQELHDLPAGIKASPTRIKPWGTGQAILTAEALVPGPFAVVNADDFYGLESFRRLFDCLREHSEPLLSEYALVGYLLRQTLSEYGSVSRGVCELSDDHALLRLREIKRIEPWENGGRFTDEDGAVHFLAGDTTVSMNMWGFTPALFEPLGRLFLEFLHENSESDDAEFLIPEAVGALVKKGEARVKVLSTSSQWLGITYQQDKAMLVKAIGDLIANGEYPVRLWG